MKTYFSFDLENEDSSDKYDYKIMLQANKMFRLLSDIDDELRNIYKHQIPGTYNYMGKDLNDLHDFCFEIRKHIHDEVDLDL